MSHTAQDIPHDYEPRVDTTRIAGDGNGDVDYEPHPDRSLKISPEHQRIIDSITGLYSGSCSEDDMQVYAEKAIYDDPLSFCDTRYKIAGQWYGLPKIFSKLETKAREVVKDEPNLIVFKQRHEYTLKGINAGHEVDSLISLSLDDNGKVKYHKDQWNAKDYSHNGFGMKVKQLNGDQLTKITQPPKSLKADDER